MGGLAIFIGISISIALVTIIMGDKAEVSEILSLVTATIILLFVGIKDDLMEISSRKKLFTQIVAALLLILLTGNHITNFYGLLGIHNIPKTVGIAFTVYVYILIINAYNLIDGIDGLAAGIGIIFFGFCGIYFIVNSRCIDGFLSFASIGGLVAFSRYNISNTRKVFMGDTGSMVIGLILTYQIVKILSIDPSIKGNYQINNIPVVILALLSYPLFDTLRVFIVRIKNKKSPFSADRKHIHHSLIDLGLSHLQASLLIIVYTIMIVGIAIITRHFEVNIHMAVILIIGITLLSLPNYIKNKRIKKCVEL
jgi:UDP-N-acetylmuramyl pentapeptide phosphotransferase/UDP-N-acetylglucosamine-1-phosphate transferase